MLVTRYLQERLLYRLSISPYHDHFFLKGGALLYAHERFMARPTLDIDFMGHNIDNDKENVKEVFSKICAIPYETDEVTFHTDTLRTNDIAIEKKYPEPNQSDLFLMQVNRLCISGQSRIRSG